MVAKLEQLGVEAASVEGCVLSGAERLLARGRYEAQRFAPRGHLKHSPLLAMGARVLGSPLASLPAAARPPSKDDAWRDAGGAARERACDELTQAARRVGEMPPGQRRQGAAALWVAPPHLPARPRERRPFYVLWCVPWCVFHVRAHFA